MCIRDRSTVSSWHQWWSSESTRRLLTYSPSASGGRRSSPVLRGLAIEPAFVADVRWVLSYLSLATALVGISWWLVRSFQDPRRWRRGACACAGLVVLGICGVQNPWNLAVVGALAPVLFAAISGLFAFLALAVLEPSDPSPRAAVALAALGVLCGTLALLALVGGFVALVLSEDHGPDRVVVSGSSGEVRAVAVLSWADERSDPVWLEVGCGLTRRERYLCADDNVVDLALEGDNTLVISSWHSRRRVTFDAETLDGMAVESDSSTVPPYPQWCT